ncbi:MAG: efflux RND transporter permease subunit [Myxococcota bacterium]
MAWRETVRSGIERWVALTYDHAWLVVLATAVGVGALASQIPEVRLETRIESFLHEDDPLRVSYEDFRARFGRDDTALLTIEAPDLFDATFLERLRALHEDLEARVPHLEEVTSLINARETRGEGDTLVVGELFEEWPETDAEREAIRERALANRFYQNLLISRDRRMTVVVVEPTAFMDDLSEEAILAGFDDGPGDPEGAGAAEVGTPLGDEENMAVTLALDAIVAEHDRPDFRIHATGAASLTHAMNTTMRKDMATFTLLSIVAIAVFLGVLFRRVSGVLLPLLVVLLTLVGTIGLIPILGHTMGLPTQILPSFLLAMGVGGAVHLMAIFYQGQRAGRDERDAVVHAGGHSGLAIVMTSLTTAGALASFASAELAPVGTLGVVTPLGVLLALVLTLTLLPALIALLPIRPPAPGAAGAVGLSASQRWLVRCGEFALDHRGAILTISAALIVTSLLGISMIRFGHAPLDWFPEDYPFRVATELTDRHMGGSLNLEALVDTGVENGMHDPELLRSLDRLRAHLDDFQLGPVISGKSLSLADTLKEIHQALNENRPDFYVVPDDARLVAQELFLFENTGTDDLTDVVDSRFQVGRFSMRAPMVDAYEYAPYLEQVALDFRRELGDDAEVTFTGLMPIMGETLFAVVVSMARSYLIAFAVIGLLMVVLIGDLRLGLAAMIPNLAPIAVVLGAMGWLGRPLDTFTMLVGSIAIGLAVDDTIHFMHNFRHYLDKYGDPRRAVAETLATTGQALLITSLVLTTGFAIYTFATMEPMVFFGIATGSAIVLAFLADIIMAPALMTLLVEARRPRPALAEETR